MKLENEHVLSVQTSPKKSYNPFDSDDEDSDGYAKGKVNGYDIKSFETTPDSLTFHLDNSNLSWEEAILRHSQILSNSVGADASNEVLYRKDNELFTDKVVTECELPELMFSYKDNGFHSVKDIGIDDGIPTLDKVWIENQDNYETTKLPTIQVVDDNVDSDLLFMDSLKTKSDDEVKKDRSAQENKTENSMKESGLIYEVLEKPYSSDILLKADEFKPDSSKKEEETNCGWRITGDLVESDGLVSGTKDHQSSEKDEENGRKVEKAGDEVSEKEHCNDNLPLEHTVDFPAKPLIMHDKVATTESNELRHADMYTAKPLVMHEVETTSKSNEAHQSEITPVKPLIKYEAEAIVESNQSTKIQNDEPTSFQSVELPATQELPGSIVTNSFPYNSTVETGSIVLDFNANTSSVDKENEEVSQKTETEAAVEKPQTTVEKPPGVQSMSRDEGGSLPGFNSILDCGTNKRVHGETSFSAAMPPPSSITYMGPVAHSGNISLRSESSAGSTRSFAFPVLQAEWNSSPVRMAKADQGHLRKQRGWVHSLVCCKF